MTVNTTSGSWGAYAENNSNNMKEEIYENFIDTMFRHFTDALLQRPKEFVPVPIAGWPTWPEPREEAIGTTSADHTEVNNENLPDDQATSVIREELPPPHKELNPGCRAME